MRHFLAYGNSDQASFRDPEAQETFDYMTVPGTIASYFEDATAAFVLSSELDYIIDPRTPLFQARIGEPRASHRSLARWMHENIAALVEEEGVVHFDAAVYSDAVISGMTEGLIDAQRSYGQRAGSIADKMGRYRRLLAEAQGTDPTPLAHAKSPSFVLAPYFVATRGDDDWTARNTSIWDVCSFLSKPDEISAVVASMSVDVLPDLIDLVPESLSDILFFWISDFNEHEVSVSQLEAMCALVSEYGRERHLVNLYGGFYSIALSKFGLWGMNNGLGYSESRAWPQLPATGAAPPRYYVPNLHSYFTPSLAQLMMDTDEHYWCPCSVCEDRVAGGYISVVDLPYHEVKKHLALCRRMELDLVAENDLDFVIGHLEEEFDRFEAVVAPELPTALQPDISYLHRWRISLEEMGG